MNKTYFKYKKYIYYIFSIIISIFFFIWFTIFYNFPDTKYTPKIQVLQFTF